MSEWYFMSGGEQQGPVTAAQLKGLASTGTLKPDDLVWNQTMTEWVVARRVKGLPFAGQAAASRPAVAASAMETVRRAPAKTPAPAPEPEPEPTPAPPETFDSPEHADQRVSEPARKIESSRTADEGSTGAAELMGQTRSWVGLMSFLFFIAIALTIAYEVWLVLPVAKGATSQKLLKQAHTAWGLRQIIRAIAAVLMLIPWLSLMRLGSAMGRAKSSGSSDDVDNALRAQKSFWKSLTVISILVIVMGVSAYLYKMVLKK